MPPPSGQSPAGPRRSPCPVASALDILGDTWTLLVVRDLLWFGKRRFADLLSSGEGISTNILAERLDRLEREGLVRRRKYQDRPPRYEYELTEKGYEFCTVLMTITAWGDRWTAGEAGPPVLIRHRGCGQHAHADVRCSHCGEPLRADEVDVEEGPGQRAHA